MEENLIHVNNVILCASLQNFVLKSLFPEDLERKNLGIAFVQVC